MDTQYVIDNLVIGVLSVCKQKKTYLTKEVVLVNYFNNDIFLHVLSGS